MPPTSRSSPQELPRKRGYRTPISYESIPNLEWTKNNNTVWDWDETGLVRGMTDELGGDVECTQTSAHVNRGLMLTDSIGVSSAESDTALYADNRTQWKYDDLLEAHPDEWHCVPLYNRVSVNNNVKIKVENEDLGLGLNKTRECGDLST